METSLDAGTEVCSNSLGHMTKMAATPIYGEKPLKILSRTRRPMTLVLVCSIENMGPTKFFSNDDPRLTLTYLMSRSKTVSMIRKYREEEPPNLHETPGRQNKQSNQLSLPHQDDCSTRIEIK